MSYDKNPDSKNSTSWLDAEILVSGMVQQVGFREKAASLAQALGLKGFVENLQEPKAEDERHQPVRVFVQGRKRAVEIFIEALKEMKNTYIKVERLEVQYRKAAGADFQSFYILREEKKDEMGPRMDTAIRILKSMDEGIRHTHEKIDTGFEEMGKKIDTGFENMGKKMDEGFDNLGKKIDTGFENMGKKMDEGFDNLGKKIDTGFDNMGKKMDEGFGEVKNEIRLFRKESSASFGRLETKSDAMAVELRDIHGILEKSLALQEDIHRNLNNKNQPSVEAMHGINYGLTEKKTGDSVAEKTEKYDE